MKNFIEKIRKTDSCWNWIGAKSKNGYGSFRFNRKNRGAHCVAYILFKGDIVENMFVCHTCDNRLCVNPEHLFLGTQSDNMLDCSRKGRLKTGGRFKNNSIPVNRSISEETAIKIINAIKNKQSLISISKQLNVSYQLVRDIKRKRSFKNLER